MQHLDEGTIHSWLDGALSADEAARVEAHVKECPECAAAVAEARGFIAGSSRILTALDNAPRGVIPAIAPGKRLNPLVWRVAATVLVVAAGTLVVVQNRGRNDGLMSVSADSSTLSLQSTSVAERAPEASAPAATVPTATRQTTTGQATTGPAATAATEAAPNRAMSKAPAIALSGKTGSANQRADMNVHERRALEEPVTASIGQRDSAVSNYAEAGGRAALAMKQSLAAGAVAMDAATEPERLKVVGTPRRIGVKVTLYEVAPGDTVTLTEPTQLYLSAVVVTGAAVAPMGRAREKTMAPPSAARADAAIAAAPDSQRAAGAPSAPAPARTRPIPAPVTQVEVANGVTTISWADATTGNVLKLSGRIPEAQLREIKIRIEMERATAAAKKLP